MHHASTRALLFGFSLLAVIAGCAHGDEPRGPVIQDFEIVGNEAVDEGDIKDQILTAESSWIPFTGKERFDPIVCNADLERIERYYQARGYFQAEVVEDEVQKLEGDAVKLQVRVREGEPTRISGVNIAGLDELPDDLEKEVRAIIDFRPGDIWQEEQWESLDDRLEEKLIALGYAEAQVDGEAKVDLGTQQALLELEVDTGVRYHPGDIKVEVKPGARVEAWRVEEQVREAMEDEEWYSQEARREAQQRVFNMGVFGAAEVTPLAGDPQTQRLPLKVEVAEAPFHEVAAGFGVGIEQLRQEAHVIGEYTHRDFLGDLRQLRLRAVAGYAFIPNAYEVFGGGDAVTRNGIIGRLTAELEQPRLFHPNFRLRTEAELERAIEPAYSYNGGAVTVGVPWRPWTWLIIEPSYHFEVYSLGTGETSLAGDVPELLFGCEGTCILSYLEQTFVFDRRDDPQDPRTGYMLQLALQEGGGPLGGSFDYLRLVPEVRGYTSFLRGGQLTLAGRVRVGTLIPLTGDDLETPIVARFFSGGDGMRGFSARRLAPQRLIEKRTPAPDTEFNAEPVPIGGNGLFEASLEARYRLTQVITLATFVDTGFVTTGDVTFNRPSYFTDNLLWAVGAGVRYGTPVGPVRLDLAYRLPFGPPLPVYDVPDQELTYLPASGCFGIGRTSDTRGGAPEGVCAIHLSIGEAF